MQRSHEDNRKGQKRSRTWYVHYAKKKKVLQEQPLESKILAVRVPKKPEMNVENAATVYVTCFFDASKNGACAGVWVCKEDFPWLVAFAAEEVANANGEELFAPDPADGASDQKARLKYCVGTSRWEMTWTDQSTKVVHTLQRAVPRKRLVRGGSCVIPPDEFIAIREKTKLELLREARNRGYDSDVRPQQEVQQ